MSSINWIRLIFGGLLAGVIINVSGIGLAHFVLGPEYVAAFKAKLPAKSDVAMLVQHLGMRFWFGLLCMFVYAGFRPRFGPGPWTAVVAGTVVFLSTGLITLLTLQSLGLLTGNRMWIAAGWTFVETIIAALVGAWVYREPA